MSRRRHRISFAEITGESLSPHRLFLLKWKDALLRDEAASSLIEHFAPKEMREFNCARIRLTSQNKASDVISRAEEMPFLAPRRFIYAEDVESLPLEEQRTLAAYLPALPSSTALLLEAKEKNEREKRKSSKKGERKGKGSARKLDWEEAVEAIGLVILCGLDEKEVPGWVRGRLKKMKYDIDPQALKSLIARVGEDLTSLNMEMEKLTIYAGKRREISQRMVEALVPYYPQAQMIQLANAIMRKDTGRALSLARELAEEKEDAPAFMGYMASVIRGRIERKDFLVRDWDKKVVRTLTQAHLTTFLEYLYRADLAFKTGKDPRIVVDTMIVSMGRI